MTDAKDSMSMVASQAPVTMARRVRTDLEVHIRKPWMDKCKHGSDSGTYDIEDRHVPFNFENIFSKYAQTDPNRLTFRELWQMTEGKRQTYDLFGWFTTKLEWLFLYMLARDEDGLLPREAIRRCLDGSLFEYCANRLPYDKKTQ